MKNSAPVDLDSIAEMSHNSSYARHLGLEVIEVSKGRARISMKIKEELLNPSNSPHGGAILSLADHTCGTAAMTLGPCVGGQFSVNFLSSPNLDQELVAEAGVIHNGRRTRIIEVEVRDPNAKLVAKGTAVGIVLE
ncbi:MAG: PaaI family thioesterase [Thermodesulfobacteriota bacterium]|nr:PaaI family thioesterase [Thermodesulfobacteriota bacterium]